MAGSTGQRAAVRDESTFNDTRRSAETIRTRSGHPRSATLERVREDQLDRTPVPGKWSIRQVVCHIADFEPIYADRMKRVLVEDNPTMFGGDPDVFAAGLHYEKRGVCRQELS